MGRRKTGKENIRNIQQSHGTYYVSIPVRMMRELDWQERQRVEVTRSGKKLIIKDYEE